MVREYKKALKELEKIKKLKVECLVRARRGEFWIKENSPELNNVTKNFEDTKRYLKEIFEIKRLPWWIHVIAHAKMFFDKPVWYFLRRPSYRKVMVDSYWEFKRIKKEWEDDFSRTEEAIDLDYKNYNEACKTIEKMEPLLKDWERKVIKKLKKKVKRGTKVII